MKSCSQKIWPHPAEGAQKRSLKLGFQFCYINNPGKPDLGDRRFASTERPKTVPTSSCRPMVSDTKSLNYYGFAHITVPTAVPACAFSLGGDAISLFCDVCRNGRVCEQCSNKKKGRGLSSDTAIGIEWIQFCTLLQRQKAMRAEKS